MFEGVPILERDIEKADDLDKEIRASGFDEDELKAMENIHEHYLNKEDQDADEGSDDEEFVGIDEEDKAAKADESSAEEDEEGREKKVRFAPASSEKVEEKKEAA